MMSDELLATAGHLHYKGDVTKSFNMDKPYGPKDITREMIWPVSISYDPETNLTTVGFSYQTPPHILQQMQARSNRGK